MRRQHGPAAPDVFRHGDAGRGAHGGAMDCCALGSRWAAAAKRAEPDALALHVGLSGACRFAQPARDADLALRRPGTGIAPDRWSDVVGRPLAHDVQAHTTLEWAMLAGGE